jgi:hypothetical protein
MRADVPGTVRAAGDLFPGVKITDARNTELEAALQHAAAAMKLELTGPQVRAQRGHNAE